MSRSGFPKRVVCGSLEETHRLSLAFGKELEEGAVVCFFGGLGVGKTTFIKGIVEAIGGYPPEYVSSPTFSYLNIYAGSKTVYHFDLYRLRNSDEFLSMGFDEYLFAGGVCCIEWSEKIASLLPPEAILVEIRHLGEESREVSFEKQ